MPSATVLVVDDEKTIRDSICDILELQGIHALNAPDGLQALTILEEQIPDLIVSDIMMPNMNGYQLYQRVMAKSEWSRIPFVFLTAKGEEADVRFGKELGVDDYLQKPIEPEDLLATIFGKLRRFSRLESTRLPEDGKNALSAESLRAVQNRHTLTDREVEVLQGLLEGLTNREIAERLVIATSTVKTHISNILSKMGVKSRSEAVAVVFGTSSRSPDEEY